MEVVCWSAEGCDCDFALVPHGVVWVPGSWDCGYSLLAVVTADVVCVEWWSPGGVIYVDRSPVSCCLVSEVTYPSVVPELCSAGGASDGRVGEGVVAES